MSPTESLKTPVVTVERDPFAIVFYCQRRKVGIGDEIAADCGVLAEATKNIPMSVAGTDPDRVR